MTVAEPETVLFVALVAVTVTVAAAEGAVKTPAEVMVPAVVVQFTVPERFVS